MWYARALCRRHGRRRQEPWKGWSTLTCQVSKRCRDYGTGAEPAALFTSVHGLAFFRAGALGLLNPSCVQVTGSEAPYLHNGAAMG